MRMHDEFMGNEIFELSFNDDDSVFFDVIPQTRFFNPISPSVIARIVDLYQKISGGLIYNGRTVCLETIYADERGGDLIHLSIGSFYDFLAYNVIGREVADGTGRLIEAMKTCGADADMIGALELLGEEFSRKRRDIKSVFDIVSDSTLPNAIAISVLVHDEHGGFLLSERTNNVIISKGLYGVSATGTLDPQDIAFTRETDEKKGMAENPFVICAQRELLEETSIDIPIENFTFRGFIVGKAKLQPIAIIDAVSDVSVGELIANGAGEAVAKEDGRDELIRIAKARREDLRRIANKCSMTEASKYHLSLHFAKRAQER